MPHKKASAWPAFWPDGFVSQIVVGPPPKVPPPRGSGRILGLSRRADERLATVPRPGDER